jgi:TonB family protein
MNRLFLTSLLLSFVSILFAQQDSTAPMSLSEGGLFELDEFPVFKGCKGMAGEACTQRRMYEFVKKNLKYPTEAKRENIEGSIMLHFTITEKGKIENVKALNDIGGNCKKEALRLLDEMKWNGLEWLVGKRKGVPTSTKVWYVVHFELAQVQRPAPAFQMEFGTSKIETTFSSGDEKVYNNVEKMPLFPYHECETVKNRGNTNVFEANRCANKAFKRYLDDKIKYPNAAFNERIEGTVVIAFVIERDGSLTNVRLVQDVKRGCGQAVLDVITEMQESIRWIPGKIGEENKRVKYFLSYRFSVKKEKKKRNTTSTSTNE